MLTLKSTGFDHFEEVVVTYWDLGEAIGREAQGSRWQDLDAVHPLDVDILQFREVADGSGNLLDLAHVDQVDEINIDQSVGGDLEDLFQHGVGHVGHVSQVEFFDAGVDVVAVASECVEHFGRFEFAAVNTRPVAAEIFEAVDSARKVVVSLSGGHPSHRHQYLHPFHIPNSNNNNKSTTNQQQTTTLG